MYPRPYGTFCLDENVRITTPFLGDSPVSCNVTGQSGVTGCEKPSRRCVADRWIVQIGNVFRNRVRAFGNPEGEIHNRSPVDFRRLRGQRLEYKFCSDRDCGFQRSPTASDTNRSFETST